MNPLEDLIKNIIRQGLSRKSGTLQQGWIKPNVEDQELVQRCGFSKSVATL